MGRMAFVKVGPDGHRFAEGESGKLFVPIGCNYFDPDTGWAPKIWSRFAPERVNRQMEQIASQGLNALRIFLDVAVLNPTPGSYDPAGFAKVRKMIELAKSHGLRIIFSGPNGWEGGGMHAWGDFYADEAYLAKRCELWQKIIKEFGGEPAVMTWELMNEPHVGWAPPEGHLPHHPPGRLAARLTKWREFSRQELGQEVTKFPTIEGTEVSAEVYRVYLRFLESLTDGWTARQCQAIRDAGARQMISLGIHQSSVPIYIQQSGHHSWSGFSPRKLAKHLDYTSMHFYALLEDVHTGMIEPQITRRRGYLEIVCRGGKAPGKPLVLEEFGWKGGALVPGEKKIWPQEHQTMWCEHVVRTSAKVASGWLNWAYADSSDPNTDISGASGLWRSDMKELKHWGRRFVEIAAEYKANPPTEIPAGRRYTLDLADYLREHQGRPTEAWLATHCVQVVEEGIEVEFTGP
ncbi:MAG: cellulase family glycosylhydrolase [Phycisphaeraceae bacterium]|nr:cellulase family glycosylhydrolase [Phycisphaeraceae bacterium]